MIIIIITNDTFNKLIQAYGDKIAEDAIREARACGEVQELERIRSLPS